MDAGLPRVNFVLPVVELGVRPPSNPCGMLTLMSSGVLEVSFLTGLLSALIERGWYFFFLDPSGKRVMEDEDKGATATFVVGRWSSHANIGMVG